MDDLQNPHVRFQRGLKGAQRGGHLCQRLFKQIKDVGRCMYTNMANWRRCRQKVKTQGKSKKQPDTKNLCQRWISFIPHTPCLALEIYINYGWCALPESHLVFVAREGKVISSENFYPINHQIPNTAMHQKYCGHCSSALKATLT